MDTLKLFAVVFLAICCLLAVIIGFAFLLSIHPFIGLLALVSSIAILITAVLRRP